MSELSTNSKLPRGLAGKPSAIVILFSVCFFFWFIDYWRPFDITTNEVIFNHNEEVFQRYSYLPAMFLNKGSFEWNEGFAKTNPVGPKNIRVSKFNYGSALMYSPFFIAAWCHSSVLSMPLQVGFSQLFGKWLRWGSMVYVILGIFFLRKFLLRFFSEHVVAFTLIVCLFGNLLFYYTLVQSELPESHLFFLFTVFLFLCDKWHAQPGALNSLAVGLVLGLISLVRFFELYILIVFVFWNVNSTGTVVSRLRLFKHTWQLLILIFFGFIVAWAPQFVFDYNYAGALFFDFNPTETYDLSDSRINDLFFSYKQGLLPYSPVIVLSFIALISLKHNLPVSKPVLILIFLVILVLYGASFEWRNGIFFGARRLCPATALFATPIALMFNWYFYSANRKPYSVVKKLLFIVIIFCCCCMNISQNYLVIQRKIVPREMNEERFWLCFRIFKFSE